MTSPASFPLDAEERLRRLQIRLGPVHARLRLGLEREHELQAFGQGLNFLHLENMPFAEALIRLALRATGTYRRGLANAAKVRLRRNDIFLRRLPKAFENYSILHLSDLHADMSEAALRNAARLISSIKYDLCVMTGDFRGKTYGPFARCLEIIADLVEKLDEPIYGVLGNHDSIAMAPDLEEIGVQMLINESVRLSRGPDTLYLAGVDDAHFFRADNVEKAAADIPEDVCSILLSHTPEIYRQAAHAGFDLMLSGHTHGGQICLPGGYPIVLEAKLPRALGSGPWRHAGMVGYTSVGVGSSVVPVRFNNRPEIALHRLVRAVAPQ